MMDQLCLKCQQVRIDLIIIFFEFMHSSDLDDLDAVVRDDRDADEELLKENPELRELRE